MWCAVLVYWLEPVDVVVAYEQGDGGGPGCLGTETRIPAVDDVLVGSL